MIGYEVIVVDQLAECVAMSVNSRRNVVGVPCIWGPDRGVRIRFRNRYLMVWTWKWCGFLWFRKMDGVLSKFISADWRGERGMSDDFARGQIERDAPASMDALGTAIIAVIVENGQLGRTRVGEGDDSGTGPASMFLVKSNFGAGIERPVRAGAGCTGVHAMDQAVAMFAEAVAEQCIFGCGVSKLSWGVFAAGNR